MSELRKRRPIADDSTPPSPKRGKDSKPEDDECKFVGKPIPAEEARKQWPKRYLSKEKTARNPSGDSNEDEILQAKCHYRQAMVDGVVYSLFDDAYVQAEEGKPNYIAKITEFFETSDQQQHFRAQWFYRAQDTMIKDHAELIDQRRVFFSDVQDDNPLDCLVRKVKIAKLDANVDPTTKETMLGSCELYYDLKYSLAFSNFSNLFEENDKIDSDTSSTVSSESSANNMIQANEHQEPEMTLLDLYSGCGAMSTGLCLGASISGSKLVTRWAVDINEYACESIKKNHPETQVRNEAGEDFLSLLKEWKKLCKQFTDTNSEISKDIDVEDPKTNEDDQNNEDEANDQNNEDEANDQNNEEEFEVERLLAIQYGDPNKVQKSGLHFKVRWKGYGPTEDTWEPVEGLSDCTDRIREFVLKGSRAKILPLPGQVDFICGGPPCQGVSGFNRFRQKDNPLKDPKNQQLVVFMDIVDYLKPKYVLMENVVDILKFAGGYLGRYAVGRLVGMNYQTRLGIMAAGSYGLPQFRLRCFLWGADRTHKLPQYPLPTHDAIYRGTIPTEFEESYVSYGKDQTAMIEKAIFLGDAIADLPSVNNNEDQDERPYGGAPRTDFQRFIRLKRADIVSCNDSVKVTSQKATLYDHRPLKLNNDDFERVCQIPKKKGANFRDLPGVLVGSDNKVQWDPAIERKLVSSGKPLVPDYAMSFVGGSSSKPFGRLWWDETVATVVTRAEPHNQVILHPIQDRVLTIRENARLQGFPDCYRLYGPIKERYKQVGNAVAVPVGLALGYSLGRATQGLAEHQPLTTLPFKFPQCLARAQVEESG